ncbi:MAG: PAS domain-containing protein, partial [Fidelibacterota bacterium]
ASVGEGIVVFDRNFRYLAWNSFMENLTGLKADVVVGQYIFDVFPFLKKQGVDKFLNRALNGEIVTGPDSRFKVPATRKKGWFVSTYTPRRGVDGNIEGVVVLVKDITDRKKADRNLALQRKKLADILEGTNAGTWEWNVQTGELVLNERWAEIIGYTLKELEPVDINTWINNVHPADLPKAQAMLEKHFSKELDYYDVEFRQPHKNGSWVWVNARGKVIEWTKDGKPLRMSGTHLDITDRKEKEKEISMLANALKSIQECVSITDENDKLIFVNDALLKTYGYSREELIGRSVGLLRSTKTREATKGILSATQKGGWQGELINRRKDGSEFPVQLSTSLVRDENGKIIALIGVAEDITERKRNEAVLRDNEQLLRTIAENYPNSYVSIIEKDLTVGFSSGQEFKKQNLNPDDFTGLPVQDVFGIYGKDILKTVKTAYQKTFRGASQTFELHVNNQYQLYNTVPFVNEQGRINRILVVVENITERRESEDQLRRTLEQLAVSEKRWKTIIETEPECVEILSPDGLLIDMNRAGLEMIDADSLDQVKGQSIFSLIAPEYQDAFRAMLNRVIEGNREMLTFEMIGLKGTRRYMESHSVPLHREGKGIIGLLSVTRDITEHKKAEQELRFQEKQLRLIFNSVDDIIYYIKVEKDSQYRFVSVNKAFLKATGLTEEQIVGKSINQVIPESSLSLVLSNYAKAIREKIIVRWEETSQYPAGMKTGIVSVAPIFDDAGKCTHLIGSVHDITERQQAEEALREAERMNKTLLEMSPVCNKIIDSDFKLQYMSAAGINLLKIPDIKLYYGKKFP